MSFFTGIAATYRGVKAMCTAVSTIGSAFGSAHKSSYNDVHYRFGQNKIYNDYPNSLKIDTKFNWEDQPYEEEKGVQDIIQEEMQSRFKKLNQHLDESSEELSEKTQLEIYFGKKKKKKKNKNKKKVPIIIIDQPPSSPNHQTDDLLQIAKEKSLPDDDYTDLASGMNFLFGDDDPRTTGDDQASHEDTEQDSAKQYHLDEIEKILKWKVAQDLKNKYEKAKASRITSGRDSPKLPFGEKILEYYSQTDMKFYEEALTKNERDAKRPTTTYNSYYQRRNPTQEQQTEREQRRHDAVFEFQEKVEKIDLREKYKDLKESDPNGFTKISNLIDRKDNESFSRIMELIKSWGWNLPREDTLISKNIPQFLAKEFTKIWDQLEYFDLNKYILT